MNLSKIWQKIKCKSGRHILKITMVSRTGSSYKANCIQCNKSFAINDSLEVALPWDRDFEHLAKFNGWKKL